MNEEIEIVIQYKYKGDEKDRLRKGLASSSNVKYLKQLLEAFLITPEERILRFEKKEV